MQSYQEKTKILFQCANVEYAKFNEYEEKTLGVIQVNTDKKSISWSNNLI